MGRGQAQGIVPTHRACEACRFPPFAKTWDAPHSYDDDGNQTSVVDNTGTTSFKYDANNRLSKKTLPSGVIFTSTYDPVGNLKTLDDGGTDTLGTVTYAYDAANRMTALVEPGTGATTTYGYDDANRRTSITYPGNLGMQISYDSAGHQTASTGGILNGTGASRRSIAASPTIISCHRASTPTCCNP